MQLKKRAGSPYWWASFTDDRGKRHRMSTKETDKRAAYKAAASLVVQIREETPKGNSVTLYAALSAYQANLKLLNKVSESHSALNRDKTCGRLKSSKGRFCLQPDMPFHTLSETDLQSLIEARVAEGNGPTTIAHELKNIRASASFAKGLRQRVPAILNWRIPKLVQKTRYMSDTEWKLVYDKLSPDRIIQHSPANRKAFQTVLGDRTKRQAQDAQDLMVCLTMCGGRWTEVAKLDRSKVNLLENTILIWGSKTQKYRMAPMPVQLKAVIERRLAAMSPDQKLLFGNDKGQVRKQSSRAIARAIEACGLNSPDKVAESGRCTVHSLRHTFASWVLQNGGDLAGLQGALGHATLHQTLRYAHLVQAESTAKLTAILSNL